MFRPGFRVHRSEDAPGARHNVPHDHVPDLHPIPLVFLVSDGALHHKIHTKILRRDRFLQSAIEVRYRGFGNQAVTRRVWIASLSKFTHLQFWSSTSVATGHFFLAKRVRGKFSPTYPPRYGIIFANRRGNKLSD